MRRNEQTYAVRKHTSPTAYNHPRLARNLARENPLVLVIDDPLGQGTLIAFFVQITGPDQLGTTCVMTHTVPDARRRGREGLHH